MLLHDPAKKYNISLCRIARRHSIPDIEQPFSRLDEIADAVRNVQRVLLGMVSLYRTKNSLTN